MNDLLELPAARSAKAPVVLVDATYHLFRAYYALPPLKTRANEPTWAILGCLNIIDKLFRRHQPGFMAVVFDAGGENFRSRIFPEYKKNRWPRCATPTRLPSAPRARSE